MAARGLPLALCGISSVYTGNTGMPDPVQDGVSCAGEEGRG